MGQNITKFEYYKAYSWSILESLSIYLPTVQLDDLQNQDGLWLVLPFTSIGFKMSFEPLLTLSLVS